MRLRAAARALFPLAGEEKKSKVEAKRHRFHSLAFAARARVNDRNDVPSCDHRQQPAHEPDGNTTPRGGRALEHHRRIRDSDPVRWVRRCSDTTAASAAPYPSRSPATPAVTPSAARPTPWPSAHRLARSQWRTPESCGHRVLPSPHAIERCREAQIPSSWRLGPPHRRGRERRDDDRPQSEAPPHARLAATDLKTRSSGCCATKAAGVRPRPGPRSATTSCG
jgi:hypothetical protein